MTLPYLLTGTPPISDPPNPQVTKDIRATGTKKPLDKSSLPKQSAKKSAKRSAKRRKQETSEAPKNHSADLTEENFLQKYISDYLDPWNCYCEKTKALRETLVEQFNAIDSENFLILINSLEEAQKGINQLSVQLQKSNAINEAQKKLFQNDKCTPAIKSLNDELKKATRIAKLMKVDDIKITNVQNNKKEKEKEFRFKIGQSEFCISTGWDVLTDKKIHALIKKSFLLFCESIKSSNSLSLAKILTKQFEELCSKNNQLFSSNIDEPESFQVESTHDDVVVDVASTDHSVPPGSYPDTGIPERGAYLTGNETTPLAPPPVEVAEQSHVTAATVFADMLSWGRHPTYTQPHLHSPMVAHPMMGGFLAMPSPYVVSPGIPPAPYYQGTTVPHTCCCNLMHMHMHHHPSNGLPQQSMMTPAMAPHLFSQQAGLPYQAQQARLYREPTPSVVTTIMPSLLDPTQMPPTETYFF